MPPILTGSEHFVFDEKPINKLLLDFWSWKNSNLLVDDIRGYMAEFIVMSALEQDLTIPKKGWEEYDILYNDIKIEIKSSAFIQAWEQRKLSNPRFSIRKTSNEFLHAAFETKRHSDVYVFCLFACKDRDAANPLVLNQWEFFVVPTKRIDAILNNQKTICLAAINILSPIKCNYEGLRESVDIAATLPL